MSNQPVLLRTQAKPEIVRLQWGINIYDYYLNSISDLNKFLYIKSKAGLMKASAWLKKNSYKTEKIER